MKYANNATFTMALRDDLGPYDPYRTGLTGKLAYDSLLNQEPDGKFVSGLAERWTADATSATFRLKAGITCSDGSPLTASQVAADLTYLGDPKNSSPQYGVLVPAVPFKATAEDGTRTVKIAMGQPFGFLLNTIGLTPIVCAKGMKNPKLLQTTSDGTGPYVLTKVVSGQSWTFTVRKGYTWGPDGARTSAAGAPAKIVVRVVANESTTANLLLSGELNLAQVGGEDRQRLEAQDLEKRQDPSSGAWLWFNHLGGRPTADKRLRRALVLALDLDQLVKVNTGGTGRAATGLVARKPKPCAGDTVAGALPTRDLAAAGSLLDEAGWVKGGSGTRVKDGKPLTLDLHYRPGASTFNRPTAELIAEQWRGLGARVNLSGDGAAAFEQVLFKTSNYDVYMQGFGATLPSQMVPFVSGPTPPKGQNLAGIDNKTYQNLVAKAATKSAPEACSYWNSAENALWKDLDIVPIAEVSKPWYLKDAKAQIAGFDIPIPTSIRMLDGR